MYISFDDQIELVEAIFLLSLYLFYVAVVLGIYYNNRGPASREQNKLTEIERTCLFEIEGASSESIDIDELISNTNLIDAQTHEEELNVDCPGSHQVSYMHLHISLFMPLTYFSM